jgi:hypothetical protein
MDAFGVSTVLAAHSGGSEASALLGAILTLVGLVAAIVAAVNKSQNSVWVNGLPYCPNCRRQISLKSSRPRGEIRGRNSFLSRLEPHAASGQAIAETVELSRVPLPGRPPSWTSPFLDTTGRSVKSGLNLVAPSRCSRNSCWRANSSASFSGLGGPMLGLPGPNPMSLRALSSPEWKRPGLAATMDRMRSRAAFPSSPGLAFP